MSKKIASSDKINETTLHEILLMIDAKLNHIEDITGEFDEIIPPPLSESEKLRANKMQGLKELVEEFMERHDDLKEFEDELKKYKKDITPGTIGES